MPHSLIELNAMSEDQLRSIAESMNIKGAKKMSRADLGFAILDQQAISESQKPVISEPKAKRRGRPPKKEEKPAAPVAEEAAPAAAPI